VVLWCCGDGVVTTAMLVAPADALVMVGWASAGLTAAVLVWAVPGRWLVGRGARSRTVGLSAEAPSVPDRVWRWAGTAMRHRHAAAGSSGDATADMVEVLDAVARSIRGGTGVRQALRTVVPHAGVHTDDLAAVVGQLDGGMVMVDCLADWRQRRPTPVVSLATAVLTFGMDTGGSLARAVDGAAATLRERLALQGEVRVLAAQARASAVVVGAAPVAFTTVVAVADPRVASFLLTTVAGWVCLAVGVGLEVGCVAWMRSLVARAGVL
jgi:Flp pilus assembly protein TadB